MQGTTPLHFSSGPWQDRQWCAEDAVVVTVPEYVENRWTDDAETRALVCGGKQCEILELQILR